MNKKTNEGMSIQEIENFGKKYNIQLFLTLYFIISSLLTFVFFGSGWSILLAGSGGILGVLFPKKINAAMQSTIKFLFKQEKITKLILAIVGIIIAFFLPPLTFFFLGAFGGIHAHNSMNLTAIKWENNKEDSQLTD